MHRDSRTAAHPGIYTDLFGFTSEVKLMVLTDLLDHFSKVEIGGREDPPTGLTIEDDLHGQNILPGHIGQV
ncbi:MAG: hypothetical protein GWN00_07950 [Aliifodinibius sp.]|nr:hypothetical protein [Fodinibius sp.]NIV11151.1 hypothetical protein [Fodinibius sp.]NIY24741.1 hypothetical protein [Fodinibius sp.]